MSSHIKIPDIAPIIRLVANGLQTSFEFPFPIFASEDLSVHIDSAAQSSGFYVFDVGDTYGGYVTFDVAPANGQVITLSRRMVFERLSDFIEGGDFAASAINTELDFVVAGLQQLGEDQSAMIKFNEHETPVSHIIPDKNIRAGKALGFNESGEMIAVSLEGSMASPSFTTTGIGAVTRTTTDK